MIRSSFIKKFLAGTGALGVIAAGTTAASKEVHGDLVLKNGSTASDMLVHGNLRIEGDNNTVQDSTFRPLTGVSVVSLLLAN